MHMPKRSSSSFASFIRYASARDKKRVYAHVIAGATQRQQAIVDACRRDGSEHQLSGKGCPD